MLFDNPVDKVEKFIAAMRATGTVPECECFDTGIVRSIGLFQQVGLLTGPIHVSLVMGVASGMPCKPEYDDAIGLLQIALGRAEYEGGSRSILFWV